MNKKLCVLSVLLVYLLCGCVKVDIGMQLNGNGSGVFEESILVAEGGLNEAGLGDQYLEQALSGLDTNGVSITDTEVTENSIKYKGKKLTIKFSSYKGLEKSLRRVFKASDNTAENLNDDVNRITKYITTSGSTVTIDMPSETFLSGVAGESKYGYSLDAKFWLDMGDIDVISSNADSVDGTRYEWNLQNRKSNMQLTYKKKGISVTGRITLLLLFILAIIGIFLGRHKLKLLLSPTKKSSTYMLEDTERHISDAEDSDSELEEAEEPRSGDD